MGAQLTAVAGSWRVAARRVSARDAATGWLGIVLAIAVFFDWYGVTVLGPVGRHGARGIAYSGQVSGWDSVHAVKLAVLLAALLGLAPAALALGQRGGTLRWLRLAVAAAAAIAAVLIAWRLASPPFDRVSLPGSDKLQVSLHAGGLLAFAFALALAATAWKGHQAQATPAD